MKTYLEIDEVLLERATNLTGITDMAALVRLALETLVAGEAAERLAGTGGTQAGIGMIHRLSLTLLPAY